MRAFLWFSDFNREWNEIVEIKCGTEFSGSGQSIDLETSVDLWFDVSINS